MINSQMEYDKLVNEKLEEVKASKAEANYVEYTVKGQRCDKCTMWRAPNKCSAVAGIIKPEGHCDWWKKSKRKE